MIIRPAGTELYHTDGRTDMTKIIVAFRNFSNARKNDLQSLCSFCMSVQSYVPITVTIANLFYCYDEPIYLL
jgi:hypothetical protein